MNIRHAFFAVAMDIPRGSVPSHLIPIWMLKPIIPRWFKTRRRPPPCPMITIRMDWEKRFRGHVVIPRVWIPRFLRSSIVSVRLDKIIVCVYGISRKIFWKSIQIVKSTRRHRRWSRRHRMAMPRYLRIRPITHLCPRPSPRSPRWHRVFHSFVIRIRSTKRSTKARTAPWPTSPMVHRRNLGKPLCSPPAHRSRRARK